MIKYIKKSLRSGVRKMTGFDLSTIRTSVGQDFIDQKDILKDTKIMTIFDVGTNVGQTTLKYKKLFPRATIYGFEPFFDIYSMYTETFRGDKRIHAENIALADENSQLDFFVNNLSYTNSLLSSDPNYICGSKDYKLKNKIKVKAEKIDNYCQRNSIKNIDILKLDIQGGELMALKGATHMLESSKIGLIFTEIEFVTMYKGQPLFHDIKKFLEKYGYSLYKTYNISNNKYGEMTTGDAIFLNQQLAFKNKQQI